MLSPAKREVSGYRLLRLLGQGSSADVYLAEHKRHRSYVAVKLLRAETRGCRKDLWRNEIDMLSRFTHPSISRMHTYGTQDSIQFLVMDRVAQGTLRDHLVHELPISRVVTAVKQIADALQYFHAMHIIHRDVKPANILCERDGNILLADFELATDYRGCQSTMGTIAYAAPEQTQGYPCPASDQYALGVIVYQWLCGEFPFCGTSDEIVAQHKCASPPSILNKAPLLPSAIEHVLFTALAKDPGSRFTDIQTFAENLEQASQYSSYWTPSQVLEDCGTGGDINPG